MRRRSHVRTGALSVIGALLAASTLLAHLITGIGFRFKDGSHAAQLKKIVMANGKEMDLYGQLSVLPPGDGQRRP